MRDELEGIRNEKGELPIIEFRKVSFGYGRELVLDEVSLCIERGKITTIMGSNGCGKSTLLDLMTKNLEPRSGEIFLRGRNIRGMRLKEFAREVSIVRQDNTAAADITVEALVAMGRVPYLKRITAPAEEDERMVTWALEVTGTAGFRGRELASLSGGQRQRVWIAMALAQGTGILLLDEPTTYLDVRFQLELLDLVRKLNRELGLTVVMVLHDINQALYYSDTVIGLKGGRVLVSGDPSEAITSETVAELFGVKLEVAEYRGKKYVLLGEREAQTRDDMTQ